LELKICGYFFGDKLLSLDLTAVATIAIGAPFNGRIAIEL
jgi:hypothetical protein